MAGQSDNSHNSHVFSPALEYDESHPHLRLAASDGPRPDGAGLLVPTEDFGDAAVRHPELTGDDARANAVMGHFHDFMSDVVGERSAVDEDAAELVDPTLS